ncbi:MAG: hypothetical protein Q9220_005268 [cf. Caloplaca sp. 1 TL-2023]
MGAVHKYDLTSDVTHLIVGDADTPKYKFVAKERPDVKCLLPTWVEALRELWIEGGEVNVQELEARYTLPALHNLRICVTGFEDLSYRKKIEDDVNNNGGEYRANLTKDVTHLIAKEASGAKHKYAVDWNIKIVGAEWLDQSLERGMILDETLYNLVIPPSERGRDAWIRRTVSSSSLNKRSFEENTALNGPRKLRRIASAKLSSQTNGLWTDIVTGKMHAEESDQDQWSEQHITVKPAVSPSAVRSMGTSTEARPLFSTTTNSTVAKSLQSGSTPEPRRTGIFAGKRLFLHGFNGKKTSILQKHLHSHAAEILPKFSAFTPAVMPAPDNEFLLVPYDSPPDQIPRILEHVHQPVVVTDMWVERNLHRKQFIRPQENITNQPFKRFPIPGFERLVVCSTRFEDVDLLHMSKAVRLMGATYDEEFSSKASVLVCYKVVTGQEKLRHAHHWNVPTVTADWLWDCVQSGELKTFDAYLVQPLLVQHPLQPNWDQKPKSEEAKPGGKKDEDTNIRGVPSSTTIMPDTKKCPNMTSLEKPIPNHPSKPDTSKTHLPPPVTGTSGPLREISPNSSPPKPSASPSKTISTNNTDSLRPQPSTSSTSDPALSSAINSFLAHHQNIRSASRTAINTNQPPPPNNARRRKRQLLGRAPSNASNLSRASSVDTVNTDGLGTPIELTRSASTVTNNNSHLTNGNSSLANGFPKQSFSNSTADTSMFDPLAAYEDGNGDGAREQCEEFQMTQLGYEDPDALAWRRKVERKLGGKVSGDEGEEVVLVKGVGRRTRQAMGR